MLRSELTMDGRVAGGVTPGGASQVCFIAGTFGACRGAHLDYRFHTAPIGKGRGSIRQAK